MASHIATGDKPIQIVNINSKSGKFEVNVKVMKNVLEDNNVRDCDIAVISIAGAFRKGKSFMLGFFLRYLYAVYDAKRDDWIGNDTAKLEGFSWCGGSKRHTTGIWIWSKIFTTTRKSGQKIGVLLMDTQGTFDSMTTVAQNVTIFSLSQMLSSVQIFNLFNNIQDNDLQNLELFANYGQLIMRNKSDHAFQVLMFLIRDWSYPYDQPYGMLGGRDFLKDKLNVTENQPEENQKLRQNLKVCYSKIDCCLLPSPGDTAIKSPQFNGQLKDIDKDFIDTLKIFVPELLHPEKVVVKRNCGANITGKNFSILIDSYFNMIENGTGVPTPQTILQATAEVNNLTVKADAFEFYNTQMECYCEQSKGYREFNDLATFHRNTTDAAKKMFTDKATIGYEAQKSRHCTKLQSEMVEQFKLYVAKNDAKKTKHVTKQITRLSNEVKSLKITHEHKRKTISELNEEIEDTHEQSTRNHREIQARLQELQNDTYAEDFEGLNLFNDDERYCSRCGRVKCNRCGRCHGRYDDDDYDGSGSRFLSQFMDLDWRK